MKARGITMNYTCSNWHPEEWFKKRKRKEKRRKLPEESRRRQRRCHATLKVAHAYIRYFRYIYNAFKEDIILFLYHTPSKECDKGVIWLVSENHLVLEAPIIHTVPGSSDQVPFILPIISFLSFFRRELYLFPSYVNFFSTPFGL